MLRRNCVACTRWRYVHDFPYRACPWCSACEHEYAEQQRAAARRAAGYHRRTMKAAAARVATGEAVWAEPLREWLSERVSTHYRPRSGVPRWELYDLTILARVAQVDEKTIRDIRDGKTLTIDVGIADRILVHVPAAPMLEALYPYDELVAA